MQTIKNGKNTHNTVVACARGRLLSLQWATRSL